VALGLFRASAAHATPSDGAPTAPSGTATLVQAWSSGRDPHAARRGVRGRHAHGRRRPRCTARRGRVLRHAFGARSPDRASVPPRFSPSSPRGPSASWGMRASCFASTSRCVSSRRA